MTIQNPTENKYVYCVSTYVLWKGGASLLEEKRYSSSKPIVFKNNMLKRKNYTLFRFVELENN